jgi:hypothetical protein
MADYSDEFDATLADFLHTTGATYVPFEPLIASALALSYAPLGRLIQRWA